MIVAVATSDDVYTYRVEGKPMKSNVHGGWVTVPGYASVSKDRADSKKASLVRAAIKNQTGMKYRVVQNRVDGGYRPKQGTDFWGNGQ